MWPSHYHSVRKSVIHRLTTKKIVHLSSHQWVVHSTSFAFKKILPLFKKLHWNTTDDLGGKKHALRATSEIWLRRGVRDSRWCGSRQCHLTYERPVTNENEIHERFGKTKIQPILHLSIGHILQALKQLLMEKSIFLRNHQKRHICFW